MTHLEYQSLCELRYKWPHDNWNAHGALSEHLPECRRCQLDAWLHEHAPKEQPQQLDARKLDASNLSGLILLAENSKGFEITVKYDGAEAIQWLKDSLAQITPAAEQPDVEQRARQFVLNNCKPQYGIVEFGMKCYLAGSRDSQPAKESVIEVLKEGKDYVETAKLTFYERLVERIDAAIAALEENSNGTSSSVH